MVHLGKNGCIYVVNGIWRHIIIMPAAEILLACLAIIKSYCSRGRPTQINLWQLFSMRLDIDILLAVKMKHVLKHVFAKTTAAGKNVN